MNFLYIKYFLRRILIIEKTSVQPKSLGKRIRREAFLRQESLEREVTRTKALQEAKRKYKRKQKIESIVFPIASTLFLGIIVAWVILFSFALEFLTR